MQYQAAIAISLFQLLYTIFGYVFKLFQIILQTEANSFAKLSLLLNSPFYIAIDQYHLKKRSNNHQLFTRSLNLTYYRRLFINLAHTLTQPEVHLHAFINATIADFSRLYLLCAK